MLRTMRSLLENDAIILLRKFKGLAKHFVRDKLRIFRSRVKLYLRITKYRRLQTCSLNVSLKSTVEFNELCCGCSACFATCMHDAIRMEEDRDGFLRPRIDNLKCVTCGACVGVCPVARAQVKPAYDSRICYAAQASDPIRAVSSSGGIFSVIAEKVLSGGGYVCGAEWAGDFSEVRHVVIDSVSDLPRLRLSKYSQSNVADAIVSVGELVDRGAAVLFVGTPCQVAGLKSYIGKRGVDGKLLTIDVICCGVPSRKVLRQFIKEAQMSDSDKVVSVRFRNKDNGWFTRRVDIETVSGKHLMPNRSCAYEQAHFRGMSTGKLCQKCPFSSTEREGDISLGDFWGIEQINPKYNDDKGTSLVLVNSKRGAEVFGSILPQLKLCKSVPIAWALPGNDNIIHPIASSRRRQFFFELNRCSIKEAYSRCLRDTADCIIFNNAITDLNYGSMLTAYAIQEVLVEHGVYAKTLFHARVPVKWGKDSFARSFATQYLNLTEPCVTDDDFVKLNSKTDVFLVGSDQMWRTKYWKNKVDKILLAFTDPQKKRVACAISFGVDEFEGTPIEYEQFKCELAKFDLITVREESGVSICRDYFNCNAKWVLDPVYLLDCGYYERIIVGSSFNCSDALVYYGWGEMSEIQGALEACAEKHHCDRVVNITNVNLSVGDWLNAIKTARLVVTNSFHGACFAIIFSRPLIVVNDIGQGRFNSLSKLFGMTDNLVANTAKILDVGCVNLDYDKIHSIIKSEREKSLDILLSVFRCGE